MVQCWMAQGVPPLLRKPPSVALQQVFLEAQRESRPLTDPLGGPLTPWELQGIQRGI